MKARLFDKKRYRYYNYLINRFFSRLSLSQDNYLLILGGITGILAGVGAIVFHEAIEFITELFFGGTGLLFGEESILEAEGYLPILIIILIPAIGGLLVGLIAHFFEKGEKGEGIPNVIDAVASKAGIIKGSIAIKKIVGSALSIGTGGAGGKEGPIVQIGASIASFFGKSLHLSPDRLKILVGCGAAAGLSAAFNAPLGGALFAMEIILRSFRAQTFSPIIIASVFATALSRWYFGNDPSFMIIKYELLTNYEFIFYILLGLLSGLTAVYFVKVFYTIEDLFGKLKSVPGWVMPAIGGLAVGVIGLFFPGVYGFSYQAIEKVLGNQYGLFIVAALLLIKPIATSLTIGSGGNGGTFAPSLFTGAMLGGLFGQLINLAFPEVAASPGAYALVGMAGVVAGTTNASLTALIMTFEMTNNYRIILPLMLTIIISTTVARSILKGSLYTIKFQREGKEIDIYGRKVSILKKIRVNEITDNKVDFIYEYFNLYQILDKLKKSKYNTILVKDKNDNYTGQITFQDIRDAILDEETRSIADFIIAKDVMTHDIVTVPENETGERAMQIIEDGDYEYIPVIELSTRKIKGIISRDDLFNKYQKEVFLQQSEKQLEPS